MSETKVLTTNEVADEIGTEPKTLRKFFRSNNCSIEPVGQGKRYGIAAEDVAALKEQFAAWAGGKAKKAEDDDDAEPKPDKAPKKTSSRKKKTPEPIVADEEDFDDDLSLDAVADPDDDEILSLDDEDLEV